MDLCRIFWFCEVALLATAAASSKKNTVAGAGSKGVSLSPAWSEGSLLGLSWRESAPCCPSSAGTTQPECGWVRSKDAGGPRERTVCRSVIQGTSHLRTHSLAQPVREERKKKRFRPSGLKPGLHCVLPSDLGVRFNL